jgi:hypothetical protein
MAGLVPAMTIEEARSFFRDPRDKPAGDSGERVSFRAKLTETAPDESLGE